MAAEPVPLFDPGPSLVRDREALHRALDGLLDSGRFVLGPAVEAFERHLSAYVGSPHVVGVASCSDALELSLRALGLRPGDAVLTTPFTFVATAEAIANAGLVPLFCDIRQRDWLLDVGLATAQLDALPRGPDGLPRLENGARVAAAMPVHLFGRVHSPVEIAALRARGLVVIEDCAQALGGSRDDARAGSMGDAACFSFFPSKTLGGLGDGGAVAVADDGAAARLRRLRQHGADGRAVQGVRERGRNSRLDALQAAFLDVKLARLDDDIAERRALSALYERGLEGTALTPLETHHGWAAQQFVVRSPRRSHVEAQLAGALIGTAVYYPVTLDQLSPYADCPRLSALGQAHAAARESLALPLYVGMGEGRVARVVEACRRALG